ncbi:hypothetical protein H6P81_003515 [Aristolochia fimbriata]|uniref:ATPase inhibitor n=1 Tax=Aristolochia fimbriata TaxID=158543 RepID=A0AAV7FCS3_ARIFI|nr:hypothetical protein H6P81_003515 [Aristolochia fimbriata]
MINNNTLLLVSPVGRSVLWFFLAFFLAAVGFSSIVNRGAPLMAMRSTLVRSSPSPLMEASRRAVRYFSDGKGRILSEEEKAAENVYIQKMERERLEKMKAKAEKEKAKAEKEKAEKEKSNKKDDAASTS